MARICNAALARKARFHATLLAILTYGYANGVFCSRKLERATYDSVAFGYIAAGTHPDHDTLAAFRRRFLDEVLDLFVQVLELAKEMKLLKLGTVSLDGTRIHANASRHSALSHGHIEKLQVQLKTQVQELLALAEERCRIDQARYDEKMAQRAAREKERGKKLGGKVPKAPEPGAKASDQINLTDEESRIMPVAGGGFEQACNAQAALDVPTMLVVATRITQAPNDMEQVVPMLAVIQAQAALLGKADPAKMRHWHRSLPWRASSTIRAGVNATASRHHWRLTPVRCRPWRIA